MASILDLVKHYQHSIEKYQHDEKKVLKCIDKLYHLGVTVQHLQETGVGRTVNALRKEPGDVGTAARALVNKWKLMVASEENSEPEDHVHDTTNYNGHGNGKDSDDSLKQSRNDQDRSNTNLSQSKHNEHSHKNGDHSGNKRKYHSSEESENETKKPRYSHSSETEDTDKSGAKVRSETSHSESNDSQSDSESDSESSASSDEDKKHKLKIKTEPIDDHSASSSKYTSHHHRETKNEPNESSRNAHLQSSENNKKRHSKESRHSIEKSSSKERSSSSHKSSSSKDQEISERKHKSDKEKSSSSKHDSSVEKSSKSSSHKHSSSSNNEKHKSQSEKPESKSHKHRSSSHSHKSDKEKVKSSSDKDTKEKVKTKESTSSSKQSSSSDKEKSRNSSSKEKSSHSSGNSEKKHSSSSDVSKSKSKASDISEKESSHRQSSSSSHKSKSSRSKSKEEVPKKKKAQTNSEDSDEDGIDCGTGASFAEALGMISPTKAKKKSTTKKTSSPNNSFLNSDLGPAALLAPTARLAPLPPLEISALPEISPNYRPRPPPKLLPHFTNEEAMSQVISSKNQRTKVYSGNKMYGKLPSLYELCVSVLQEHIDALEYTGGVPYEILKPVVDRATPQQLFVLEHYNPYLMEDTDHLWQKFCGLRFRNKQRQELETWREMFMRCEEEQEHKLKSLTANIKLTQEAKKAPIKQTKMAYVDSVVKPPRNIARKQALHGTARTATASPAARVASLATAPGVARAGSVRPPNAAPVSVSSFSKPKKAPLMQKALQFMRGRKR